MVAQPGGERGRRVATERRHQAAALDHVDVGRRQLAVAEIVDAPAAPPAGHAHSLLKVGRQLALGRVVEAIGILVQQPDPACAQAEHRGHQTEGLFERLTHIRRRVQRLCHGVQDAELAFLAHVEVIERSHLGDEWQDHRPTSRALVDE